MDFKTRVTKIEDLDRLCEIEISAMPDSPPYLKDNAEFFYKETPGEIFGVENEDNLLIGMGRYSVFPDNSGWLETLRVHKDFQRMGAGKLVYEEYFKKAKKDNAKVIRMYTESYNTPSRNLANSLGFSLASTYGNMEITLENVEDTNMDFSLVSNMDELHLEKMKENWDRFISLNRSFFEINTDNLKWMIDKKMVYKNGDNIVIFGARMLRERGLFLGFVSGDLESGVKFAMEKSKKLGSNKLTCIFPVDNLELKRVLEKLGFKNIYDLFVMEKNM